MSRRSFRASGTPRSHCPKRLIESARPLQTATGAAVDYREKEAEPDADVAQKQTAPSVQASTRRRRSAARAEAPRKEGLAKRLAKLLAAPTASVHRHRFLDRTVGRTPLLFPAALTTQKSSLIHVHLPPLVTRMEPEVTTQVRCPHSPSIGRLRRERNGPRPSSLGCSDGQPLNLT